MPIKQKLLLKPTRRFWVLHIVHVHSCLTINLCNADNIYFIQSHSLNFLKTPLIADVQSTFIYYRQIARYADKKTQFKQMCLVHISCRSIMFLYCMLFSIAKVNLFLKFDKKKLVICSLKRVKTPWRLVEVSTMHIYKFIMKS